MIPLIFTVATTTRLPLLYVGLPMLASLSVTHGYLPPHPAPTAIATMFNADIGKTMIYGIIVAIPAIIISGPVLSKALSKIEAKPMQEFISSKPLFFLSEHDSLKFIRKLILSIDIKFSCNFDVQ